TRRATPARASAPARTPVGPAPSPPPPVTTPTPVDPAAPSSGQEAPGGQEGVTVGDMLRSHAVAGMPAPPAAPAAEPPAAPTPQASGPDETLANTTRRGPRGRTSPRAGPRAAARG